MEEKEVGIKYNIPNGRQGVSFGERNGKYNETDAKYNIYDIIKK